MRFDKLYFGRDDKVLNRVVVKTVDRLFFIQGGNQELVENGRPVLKKFDHPDLSRADIFQVKQNVVGDVPVGHRLF